MEQAYVIELSALTDEIFSFRPHGENKTHHFNATRLRQFCERFPSTIQQGPVAITPGILEQVLYGNGVEISKVMRLLARPDIYNKPVIFLAWPDGTHVLADGNHRFVIQARFRGKDYVDAYIVPEEVWRNFTIDLPPELDAL